MFSSLSRSFRLLLLMTFILGGLYPGFVWIFGKIFFAEKSEGSLIIVNDQVVGSLLLGQEFTSSNYFWGRPLPVSLASPTSIKLKERIEMRAHEFRKTHQLSDSVPIPPDLLLASGSGLDPHISPAAAIIQLDRVAQARKLSRKQIYDLRTSIDELTREKVFGLFGEVRLNVLLLNMRLDEISAANY